MRFAMHRRTSSPPGTRRSRCHDARNVAAATTSVVLRPNRHSRPYDDAVCLAPAEVVDKYPLASAGHGDRAPQTRRNRDMAGETMRALVKRFPKEGIWMEQVPVPKVSTNEVLIKVEKTAIC